MKDRVIFVSVMIAGVIYLSQFSSVSELRKAIETYIHYYNNERISLKLKCLSPVEYRTQARKPVIHDYDWSIFGVRVKIPVFLSIARVQICQACVDSVFSRAEHKFFVIDSYFE